MRERSHTRGPVRGWMLGVAVAAFAAGAAAQSGDGPGYGDLTGDDIRRMADELRQTREEVTTLRQEVSDLRAMNGEEWLTQQRADEIRSIVEDVLIDADTRQSLQQAGGAAGWDDGFFLSSIDGRFLLEVDYLAQFRYIVNFQDREDQYRHGAEIARSELTLRGHVYNRDLSYLVRADVTRNEPGLVTGLWFLKDAWVRYQMNNDWSVRFGQFKTPFNREELVAPDYQLAVERSLVNENMNLGRTQGLEVTWAGEHFRVMAATGDGATDNFGGFSLIEPGGAPINSSALIEDVEFSLSARAEWKLAGTWEQFVDLTSRKEDPTGILFGVGAHFQRGEHGTIVGTDTQEDWWAVTADVSIELGGGNIFASVIKHHADGGDLINTNRSRTEISMLGAVLQGGWYMTDNVELFGRYEWAQFNTNARNLRPTQQRPGNPRFRGIAFTTLNALTAGVNWYLQGHDSKLTVDFGYAFTEVNAPYDSDLAGWRTDGARNTGQWVLRTQYQLRF